MNSVLIVDDHALIAQGLTFALRAEGFEVHVCHEPDPELVLALAKVHRPALALVDLQFTDGAYDGLTLIEPLATTTTVLVLTGVGDPAVLGACLDAGAVGVVSKAVAFDDLLERIRAVLQGESTHSLREREELLAAHREHRDAEARRLAVFDSLSPRESEVLDYLANGYSAEAIAKQAFVSLPTVRTHIQAILRKLDVNSQIAAVARAHESGWARERSAV
jgi:two-component system, NarL family, nitrate/nitrite response regulator NarL